MKYNFDSIIDRTDTHSEKWDGRAQVFGRADVLPLWVADMDFPAPAPVVAAVAKRAAHGIYGYTARPDALSAAVMDWTATRHGWNLKQDWLIHTPGVVPAINMAINAFTRPGEGILIQPPVYPPFFRTIANNDRRIVQNPLQYENGRYTINYADLEAKLDQGVKMLVLCSPHNPVGRVWSRDELARLGELCLRREVVIVSDEIHSDIVFPGNAHIPLATVSESLARCTVTCIAPSKTFNVAGFSASVTIIPDQGLRARFRDIIKRWGMGSGNIFGMTAMEAAYRHGANWLDQLLAYLNENAILVAEYLRKNIPPLKTVRPEGTYLAWLDCRELAIDQAALGRLMIETAGVGLNDGLDFGEEGRGFMRLNFGCPRSILLEGLQRIERAVEGHTRL